MIGRKTLQDILTNFLLVFLGMFLFQTSHVLAQGVPVVLDKNTPVEGSIKAGETISYIIELNENQYLYSIIELQDIDLEAVLYSTEGEKLYEAGNLSGGPKVKTIYAVAERSGDYRLEITGRKEGKPEGGYKLRIAELRPAGETDRDRAQAEKLFAEGELLSVQNKAASTSEAMEKYRGAAALFREAGEQLREVAAITNLGMAHYSLGQGEQAVENFKYVLSITRAVGNRSLEAQMLNNIGSIYNRLGKVEDALDSLGKSLVIVRELGIPQGEASILNNIGSIHKVKGDFVLALEYAEKSADIHKKTGDLNGEANSLNTIGSIYGDMGQPQNALDYYKRSLEIHKSAGNVGKQAVTLNNIGVLFSKLGDKERALEIYLRVLSLVRESGNTVGEGHTLNNIGSIYQALKEYDKALEFYEKSLELRRSAKNLLGEAITLTDIGTIYDVLGKKDKALDLYTRALTICQEIDARQQEALVLQRLALSYVSLKQEAKGFEYFEKALSANREAADPYIRSDILANMAAAERARGNLSVAKAYIEESLEIIESFRSDIVNQELRSTYLSTKQNSYKLYIDILMQLHKKDPQGQYAAVALQASEKARARSLIETLSESRSQIRQGVDIDLLNLEQNIQQQINKKEELRTSLANRKGTGEQLNRIESDLDKLLDQLKEVRAEIRSGSPRYADLTEPQPVNIAEIQSLLDSETLLLEYSLGENASYVWAVSSDSITTYELPSAKTVEDAAKRVYESLTERNRTVANESQDQMQARFEKAEKEFPLALRQLGEMIIAPISPKPRIKRLLIVAEGALQYVPFGALPIPETPSDSESDRDKSPFQPLIVKYEVVNLPSVSTLSVLRQKATSQNKQLITAAIIADPVFSISDSRVEQSIAERNSGTDSDFVKLSAKVSEFPAAALKRSAEDLGVDQFSRLRFSRLEADQIAAFIPRDNSLKALDFAADKDLLINTDLSRYQVLHFATHGLLNSQNPELSGIVLSLVDEDGHPQDGFLRLHEIYNLRLAADLVVLSACQTALGKDIKGEGLIGLTRGFMYAGADRVVSSLWKVEDRATSELMKKFYRAMFKEKQRPAAALRTAQIEMWREQTWRNPYYWAAFTLQGEWK